MADPQEMAFTPTWKFDPHTTPSHVNQVMLSPGVPPTSGVVNEFYLTLGHVNPPVILPRPDGVLRPNVEDGELPINVIGHFAFSIERLAELHGIIGQVLNNLNSGAYQMVNVQGNE